MLGGVLHRRGKRQQTGGRRAPRRLALVAAVLAVAGIVASVALAGGSAPFIENTKFSEVTRTSAVARATVDPEGAETQCEVIYGTVEGELTQKAPCPFSPGSRPIDVVEFVELGGLAESTTYYFRMRATNEHGETLGVEHEFTTLPTQPRDNIEPAREVQRNSAKLTASVAPDLSALTKCFFEWGTNPEHLNNVAQCEQTVGAGSEPSESVLVTAQISGLAEGTHYSYRFTAENAFGINPTGKEGFRTLPSEPNVRNDGAGFVTHTSATLRGSVSPDDSQIKECFFEYGEAGHGLTKTAACEPEPAGMGEAFEAVRAEVSGLSESTTYSFRLVARNEAGRGESGVEHFTTLPTGPKVALRQAREITSESAELVAGVNPEGAPVTECYFEYGTTPAFGFVQPCKTPLPGPEESFVRVSASVHGLHPDTRYLVRIVAGNMFGSGGDQSENKAFTTAKGGEVPVVKKVSPNKGSAAGKTKVKVIGEHFEHVTAVFFGEAEATIEHVGSTEIEVLSPPGAGTVDVTVREEAGTSKITSSDKFKYGKPEISGITPDTGPVGGGTEVTVTGNGFEPGDHGTSFRFGKVTATAVECSSNTTCVVIAPPAHKGLAGHVDVQASVGGQKSKQKVEFIYTS